GCRTDPRWRRSGNLLSARSVPVMCDLGSSDDRRAYPSVRLLRRFAPRVAMVQATEARQGDHVGGGGRLRFDCSLVRSVFFERVVNSIFLVIVHVVTHQAEQMSFVQRDDMVQDLSAATANPSFRRSILLRRLNAGPLRFQPRRL